MAMKCALCKEKIEQSFLEKPRGTWIKDAKGTLHLICSNCQRKYSKEQILEQLG